MRGGKSARDIHAVVMTAQHQVFAKKEVLNQAMRLDRPGKTRAQHAPRLGVFPPGLGLLDLHALHRRGLPTEELIPLAEKLLEVPQQLIRTALDLELQEGTVIADQVWLRDPPAEWSRQFEALGLNPE